MARTIRFRTCVLDEDRARSCGDEAPGLMPAERLNLNALEWAPTLHAGRPLLPHRRPRRPSDRGFAPRGAPSLRRVPNNPAVLLGKPLDRKRA